MAIGVRTPPFRRVKPVTLVLNTARTKPSDIPSTVQRSSRPHNQRPKIKALKTEIKPMLLLFRFSDF